MTLAPPTDNTKKKTMQFFSCAGTFTTLCISQPYQATIIGQNS